jgi:hypothetical protein
MKWYQYKGGLRLSKGVSPLSWSPNHWVHHCLYWVVLHSLTTTNSSSKAFCSGTFWICHSLGRPPQDICPEAGSLSVELLTDARVTWRSVFSWVGGWKRKLFVPKKLSNPLQLQRTWGHHKNLYGDELDFNLIDSCFVLSFLFCKKYAGRLISRGVNYLPA